MFDLYNTLESYNIIDNNYAYEYLEIDNDSRAASGKLTKIASSKIAKIIDRAVGFIAGIIKKIMGVLKTGITTLKSKLSNTKIARKIASTQMNKIHAGKRIIKLVNLSAKYLKIVVGGDKYLAGICKYITKASGTSTGGEVPINKVESDALRESSSKNIVLDIRNYKDKCDHAYSVVSEQLKSAPHDYMLSEHNLKSIGTVLHNQYTVCDAHMKVVQSINFNKTVENSKDYNAAFNKYATEHINNISNNLKRSYQIIVNIVKYLSGAEVTSDEPTDVKAEVVD